MITGTSLTAAAVSIVGHPTEATSLESTSATTTYHRMTVDGVGVFYREAGPKEAPTIVLLHGFPSSSREFDTLIPLLATRYHLIAPDFPGFGQSEARHHHRMCTPLTIWPRRSTSFSSNSRSTNTPSTFMTMAGRSAFASSRRIRSGCRRLSSRMPMRIRKAWAPSGLPLRNIGPIRKRILKCSMFSCRSQRPNSVTPSAPRIPERYNPDTWTDEYAHLSRPGQHEIQGDLLYDYQTNVASYPAWQASLREYRPPTLVVWGRNDPSFISPGGEAFKRDVPDAEIHLLDAGHFAWTRKTTRSRVLFLRSWPNIPFDQSVRCSRRRDVTLHRRPDGTQAKARRYRTRHRSNIFPRR
jgi:pimeloyl-ACP methyl ester carboxylesterase